jgi:hypothetical protein
VWLIVSADAYSAACTFVIGIVGSNVTSPLDRPNPMPTNVVPTGEAAYTRGSKSCASDLVPTKRMVSTDKQAFLQLKAHPPIYNLHSAATITACAISDIRALSSTAGQAAKPTRPSRGELEWPHAWTLQDALGSAQIAAELAAKTVQEAPSQIQLAWPTTTTTRVTQIDVEVRRNPSRALHPAISRLLTVGIALFAAFLSVGPERLDRVVGLFLKKWLVVVKQRV